MRIAYCEDEPAQDKLVRAMIAQWAKSWKTAAEVILYESAEEFLFKNDTLVNETFPYDIVFLDIAMRQMNGVELARAIRQKDKRISARFLYLMSFRYRLIPSVPFSVQKRGKMIIWRQQSRNKGENKP